jgi:hypothetical protein
MTFQKGNQLAKGGPGYSANIRQTQAIITRSAFHALTKLDPKTQRRRIDVLIDAVIERAIADGDHATLKMLWERFKGSPAAIHRVPGLHAGEALYADHEGNVSGPSGQDHEGHAPRRGGRGQATPAHH